VVSIRAIVEAGSVAERVAYSVVDVVRVVVAVVCWSVIIVVIVRVV